MPASLPETLPETMIAIEVSEPGGPEVLRPVSRPLPVPTDSEILFKVAGAGLNGADLSQRKGTYPMPPGVTDIPGLEAAGTVVAVGRNVKRFVPGDAVCALMAGGGYAEYAVAPEAQCMAVPENVTVILGMFLAFVLFVRLLRAVIGSAAQQADEADVE